nr:MAG TPA: putative membrane protein [Caudoviricetes sp.]
MTNDQLQNEILKEKLAQLKTMKEESCKPSLMVYLLLALFLGGIGAHDFYVGKPVTGFTKLVFCWTGIPVIISVFNIIGALMNKQNFK